MNDCLLEMRPADSRYQGIVTEITKKFGLPSITVVESKNRNACATYFNNGLPVIAYNRDFLHAIEQMGYRAIETTFAHEIGHHHYGHMKSSNGNFLQSHENELAADFFAAFVMRYRGASLNDILILLAHPAFVETATHPSREKRTVSMENGWVAAGKQIQREKALRQNAFENFLKGTAIITSIALLLWGLSSLTKEE